MDKDSKMIISVLTATTALSAVATIAVFNKARKTIKQSETIIKTQHQLIQWVAENALELDREEFTVKFNEKATFLNIVYHEI